MTVKFIFFLLSSFSLFNRRAKIRLIYVRIMLSLKSNVFLTEINWILQNLRNEA